MVTEDLNEAIVEMEPKQDCDQVGVRDYCILNYTTDNRLCFRACFRIKADFELPSRIAD